MIRPLNVEELNCISGAAAGLVTTDIVTTTTPVYPIIPAGYYLAGWEEKVTIETNSWTDHNLFADKIYEKQYAIVSVYPIFLPLPVYYY